MVKLAEIVQFVQHRRDHADPGPVVPPTVEAIVDRLPGPVAFRKVPPRSPGVEDPENSIDNPVVIVERVPRLAAMSTMGQEGLDTSPLLIRKFVPVHGRPPVENHPAREF